ncbi:MAG: pilus assembly protein [Methylocapsa sp.]|nr:pilus assembly protein [Methylocapsa sp.]
MAEKQKPGLRKCVSGVAAVEFALVLPPFLLLFIGMISATIAVFAAASLHYAVEGAARCYSVNSTQCGTAAAAQTYAQSLYNGPNSPTFSASTPSCGRQISGTLNYALLGAAGTNLPQWLTIPLSATACFP